MRVRIRQPVRLLAGAALLAVVPLLALSDASAGDEKLVDARLIKKADKQGFTWDPTPEGIIRGSDTVEVHIEGALDPEGGWNDPRESVRPAGVAVHFSFEIPLVGTGERSSPVR